MRPGSADTSLCQSPCYTVIWVHDNHSLSFKRLQGKVLIDPETEQYRECNLERHVSKGCVHHVVQCSLLHAVACFEWSDHEVLRQLVPLPFHCTLPNLHRYLDSHCITRLCKFKFPYAAVLNSMLAIVYQKHLSLGFIHFLIMSSYGMSKMI